MRKHKSGAKRMTARSAGSSELRWISSFLLPTSSYVSIALANAGASVSAIFIPKIMNLDHDFGNSSPRRV